MPQAWVPWTFPGALDISRGFSCLVPDQETHAPGMGTLDHVQGPYQGSFVMALTVWSQTKYPKSALGALDLV
jgi:hypothetical protein